MNYCSVLASLALVAAMAQAEPTVDQATVAMTKVGNGTSYRIDYALQGGPAVVTVDIQTNAVGTAEGWISVGGAAMGFLLGDANCVVRTEGATAHAYWIPQEAMGRVSVAPGNLRAVVRAWPLTSPPDYMVVNIAAPTNVVRFYTSTEQLPGGFDNVEYKTTKMIMRKIPAKGVVWRMGSLSTDHAYSDYDKTHLVRLGEDYYAGIYEVTQGQYYNMCGTLHSCSYRDLPDSPMRAFQQVAMKELRGQSATVDPADNTLCTANAYYWPRDGHAVKPGSVIDLFRGKCGIDDMDLPTCAQWEYAARGGTGKALPNGKDYSGANAGEVGWICGQSSEPKVVGQKMPNGFGLYDVIGNVYEACLDRCRNRAEDVTSTYAEGWEEGAVTDDPKGPSNSMIYCQAFRGGGWFDYESANTLGATSMQGPDYKDWSWGDWGQGFKGFRLFCSVHAAVR